MSRVSKVKHNLAKVVAIKPTLDARNANKGTKRGLELLEKSLEDYGAGRSILLDKHGVAIAGNKCHTEIETRPV